jgi:glycosyltransferase involved in cell wall biosynthesis
MKFSLIVTTKGRTEELARLFRSLASQTFADFEVIISDQNEDERLVPVIKTADFRGGCIHIKSSGGASRGRNHGLARASGEIVGFPDDDCCYPSGLLHQVAEFFDTHPEYGYVTGRAYADDGGDSVAGYAKRASKIHRLKLHRQGVEFTFFCLRSRIGNVRFDEHMGVGSSSPWQSEEGPDFMLHLEERGVHGYYDPQLAVWHARPVTLYNAKDIDRTYRYSCGNGYFYRKHQYPSWFFAYQMARSTCGLILALTTLRLGRARVQLARLKGRWRGWNSTPAPTTSSV